MAKSVSFSSNPRNKPSPEDLDAFVHGGKGEGADSRPSVSAQAPSATATSPEAMADPTGVTETVRPSPPSKVPMKRLTFDISADLHRRMRMDCVSRGIDMAEDLRRILADNWPQKD
ncbi:MAG: hypothetical protein EON48_01015 [Acetobacteraceae bacterium]|nr:MAG: hypothetical protein EON48_01015 [Acetobacteraceae bacterium]